MSPVPECLDVFGHVDLRVRARSPNKDEGCCDFDRFLHLFQSAIQTAYGSFPTKKPLDDCLESKTDEELFSKRVFPIA